MQRRLHPDQRDAGASSDTARRQPAAVPRRASFRNVPVPVERRRSYLARQVATMALSHVQVDTPMAIVRAAAWANSLSRMGVHLPLFLVHDIGVMISLSRGAGGYVLRPRESQLARIQLPPAAKSQLDQYRKLL